MRRLLASVLLVGCQGPGLSGMGGTSETAKPQPLAPLEAQRAKLEAERAVIPDARFVHAVAAMHHFVTGWTVVAPDLERTAEGTRIKYYGKDVGLLSNAAKFADAVQLLRAWSGKIGSFAPAGPTEAGGDPLFDDAALDALAKIQTDWEKSPTKRGLHDAARALVGLTIGSCDELGLGDALAGRALAAVVLDQSQGASVDRELALLAERFGYGKTATLAPLVTRGARGVSASVLETRMCGGDRSLGAPVLARALLDASLDAGVTVATKAKADLDELRATDAARVTGIVYGWLGIQRVDGFARFENETEHAGAHDRGPFFDRGTRQLWLRTRATNAVRIIGLRLASEKSPDAAEAAFADEVPAALTSELAVALRGWHHALAEGRRAAIGIVPPTSVLGPVATLDVVETALAGLGTEVESDAWDARAAAHWALGRLDARPSHRGLVALLAHHVLFDKKLAGPEPVVGIPRKKTLGFDASGARAFAADAAPVEGAAAIGAAVANDDPKEAATAIAALRGVRPRAMAAIVGGALGASVRDFAKASALHRALVDAGVSLETRRAIGLGALVHQGSVLAAAILPALVAEARTPLLRLDLAEDAALTMSAEAGQKFLAEHTPAQAVPFAAPISFAHHRDPPGSGDLALLLSVASHLGDPARMAAARSLLVGPPSSRFAAIARHLVGLDDVGKVLALPTSAAERCELAFYLALAEDSAGHPENAAIWLQTALDEGTPQVAEWRWAAARSSW